MNEFISTAQGKRPGVLIKGSLMFLNLLSSLVLMREIIAYFKKMNTRVKTSFIQTDTEGEKKWLLHLQKGNLFSALHSPYLRGNGK